MKDALCIETIALVKAVASHDGRRLIEVEASNEAVDQEGDVILQKALLDSAADFIARGHIDIDHISEIGDRYGIPDVDSYKIGKPTEVIDLGGGRTAVRAELFKGKFRADEVWESMQGEKPKEWRASIYGFPKDNGVLNAAKASHSIAPDATRYIVTDIDWCSLALTENPVNDSITGHARLVTSKAFAKSKFPGTLKALTDPIPESDIAADLAEMFDPYRTWFVPRTRNELLAHWTNVISQGKAASLPKDSPLYGTVAGFRSYFILNVGMEDAQADIYAIALKHLVEKYASL